ncbi:MAG: methyl-accepting chemotaxis protein, partial [Steroidobacteraceae bacterium]
MIDSTYSQQLYRAGDRLMVGVVTGLVLISLAIAPLHDTWMPALVIGGSTWLLCAWLAWAHSGALVTRCTIAAALMVFSGLEIHQTQGMSEAHFAVFVLLAMLLYYRDWRPLVVGAGVIALHHLGFDLLQRNGQGVFVFQNHDGAGIVLLHAAYVVAETLLLCLMA